MSSLQRGGFALALILAVALPAFGQLQGGNIYGTLRDEQGGSLPGATLTLKGEDRTVTFVTESNGEYRFLNLPPGSYTVTAVLTGFKTVIHENIIVVVGQNVDIPFVMQVAAVEESITVSGESPIVDTRKLGTGVNFTQEELQSIPNSRDPWALLRTVPGVIVDRVNIAGNETGQQSEYAGKGGRRQDSTWTIDGVVVTDMAAVGASPTYFDYDAFEEIQISTGGHDIRQPTGGIGLNFVVKNGTNTFKGTARGFFTSEGLEASNIPAELESVVTPERADHNQQIADYGIEGGGPIVMNRAWFYGSLAKQDIRLIRGQFGTPVVDRTVLRSHNIKGSWQATSKDMVSILWFLGAKEKYGRAPGAAQVEPASARWNQGGDYPESRPHGLLKFEDNRVVTPRLFLSGKYAYYGTGFKLDPIGGMNQQAGTSAILGQTFGSYQLSRNIRPQHSWNLDTNYFRTGWGGSHDFRFGVGYRRTDAFTQGLWPGDMVRALENSATDFRARVYREGKGTNRTKYFDVYAADTISLDRVTVELGVRFDRQWGSALPSETLSNGAFPNVVPGIKFAGYDAPFTWNDVAPRVGLTWAFDRNNKTILRTSLNRYPGQLNTGSVGYSNPSGQVGYADYPWVDLNGDHLTQPNEVTITSAPLTFGGGFNPANPTAVTSANVIDPDLEAPKTTGFTLGIDHELRPNFAVGAAYNYGRSTDIHWEPWRGNLTLADYTQTSTITGTLPGGASYSIPVFAPIAARVTAGGNGRFLTNRDDYRQTFNGIELSANKRMSDRWMMRLATAYNNARHFFGDPRGYYGNPTRLDSSGTGGSGLPMDTLVDGGQVAPLSAGSGQGDVFINGKWMFNLNGAYQLPYDMLVAGNLFGKQGTPFPWFSRVALGLDGSQNVLLDADIDSRRFDSVWNLDLRWSKTVTYHRFRGEVIADLFNVLNSNVELNRERNTQSTAFQRLNSNLSPRILRFGVRVGL